MPPAAADPGRYRQRRGYSADADDGPGDRGSRALRPLRQGVRARPAGPVRSPAPAGWSTRCDRSARRSLPVPAGCPLRSISPRRSSARARMIPSGVPTSCAMPAARTPVVASFSALMSWRSSERNASAFEAARRVPQNSAAAVRSGFPPEPMATSNPAAVRIVWRTNARCRDSRLRPDRIIRTRQTPRPADCAEAQEASAGPGGSSSVWLPSSLRGRSVEAIPGAFFFGAPHRAGRRPAAARASPPPPRSGGRSPPPLALVSNLARESLRAAKSFEDARSSKERDAPELTHSAPCGGTTD